MKLSENSKNIHRNIPRSPKWRPATNWTYKHRNSIGQQNIWHIWLIYDINDPLIDLWYKRSIHWGETNRSFTWNTTAWSRVSHIMNILFILALIRHTRRTGSARTSSGFDVDCAAALYVPEGAAVEVGHHGLQSGPVGDGADLKLQCGIWLQLLNIADDTHRHMRTFSELHSCHPSVWGDCLMPLRMNRSVMYGRFQPGDHIRTFLRSLIWRGHIRWRSESSFSASHWVGL